MVEFLLYKLLKSCFIFCPIIAWSLSSLAEERREMGRLLSVGCALLAYSPACSLLVLFSKRPQLIIVALAAAFFWLCSSLLTAIFWWFIQLSGTSVWPLIIIISTLIQEGMRYGYILAYRQTENLILRSSPHSNRAFPLNDLSSGLAGGVGFGLMHSLLLYGSVLASGGGPATYFDDSCPTTPLILVSALTSLAFFILDIIWMCLGLLAEKYRSSLLAGAIVVLHLFAGLVTLTNINPSGCAVSLSLLLIIVLISLGLFVSLWSVFIKSIRTE
jgi:anterior pharynx defective protein 1